MSIAVKTADGWQVLGGGESSGGGSFDPAPVISAPVSVNGPAVQEWPVKDKEGNSKIVYLLPGNTGTSTQEPQAVYSVTLGAGVLPGVMVGSGGPGGVGDITHRGGGGGAGGVIGQGAHAPVILPVQGTATYTVAVGSTTLGAGTNASGQGQATTLAVQGQTSFTAAVGGGTGYQLVGGSSRGSRPGASGGGGHPNGSSNYEGAASNGIPGQGNKGERGGGGYGSAASGVNGGAGFDLATALNLDDTDGPTETFLNFVSVDGWIAGGGAGSGGGTATAGGGNPEGGNAKNYSGGGGGGRSESSGTKGNGGAGAVYIITDAP